MSHSKHFRRVATGCFAMLAIMLVVFAGRGEIQADVTSQPSTVAAKSGFPIFIPIDLNTLDSVSGINGQLTYNPALLSNPQIFAGPASSGFITAGNVVSPGDFRFVIYDNPTAVMDLFGQNDLYLQFDVVAGLPSNQQDVLTFTMEAASDPQGVSIGQAATVDFADITVVINDNTAAGDWSLYR